MYKLYESTINNVKPFINTAYVGDAKISADGTIQLPVDCVYINLINMSPFKISLSLSGGQFDEYIEPNSKKENIYIGKHGGTDLSIGKNLTQNVSIKVINALAPSGVSTNQGDLTILGKKVDENWEGVLPLISGSVAPVTGQNVSLVSLTANELIFPSPDSWNIQEDLNGNLVVTDLTTSQVYTFARNGIFTALVLALIAGGKIDWLGSPVFRQEYLTPQSGASNSHEFFVWDGAATHQVLAIGDAWVNTGAASAIGTSGNLAFIGNQITAGAFGVPPITQVVNQFAVTDTSQHILLDFVPSVTSTWRIGFYVAVVGTNNTLTASYRWTDNNVGAQFAYQFAVMGPSNGGNLAGFVIGGVAEPIVCTPAIIQAQGNTHVQVLYQNSTGVPNDRITIITERLQ